MSTLVDPRSKNIYLLARQPLALRRHPLTLFRRVDSADQLALEGVTRLDRRDARISGAQSPCADIEPQSTLLFIRPVAVDTPLQNRPHLLTEVKLCRLRSYRLDRGAKPPSDEDERMWF